jgi:hypothetical protein
MVLRLTLLLVLLGVAGCNSAENNGSQPAQPAVAEQPPAVPSAASTGEGATTAPEPVKPNYAQLLDEASAKLANGDLSAAGDALDKLTEQRQDLGQPEAERLSQLAAQLREARESQADFRREELLAEAHQALDQGELEAATAALEKVLAAAPTSDQSEQASELKETIEDRRRVFRELRSAMKLLASDKRGDIKAARTQLWQQSDAALPLLIKSLDSDNPVLVENTLELLRMFNQPQRTLPAMVGVLRRSSQAACWPAAIRELEKTAMPGAGPALLELARTGETSEQRQAALNALARVVDPPADTLVALLPMLHQDGPELAPALEAARHALVMHKQTDLAARRGLDAALSPEQDDLLSRLGQRLRSIATTTTDPLEPGSAAWAAMNLGVATRELTALPLTGVVVSRVNGEDPLGPAAAALDGVWDQADVATMWRHPIDKQPQIVLDLGEIRTVTAVRVWNYNEQGLSYRGWKEIEIFVSEQPALLSPVASGIVPLAPGAIAAADYGVTLPVPFVRGRYVKLQPRDYWQASGPSGLTEIQILGF